MSVDSTVRPARGTELARVGRTNPSWSRRSAATTVSEQERHGVERGHALGHFPRLANAVAAS